MKRIVNALALTLILASPFSVKADLTVSASVAKPSEGSALVEVKREDETRSNWRWFRTGSDEQKGRRDVGQVFVAPGKGGDVSIGALMVQVADVPVGQGAYGAEISLAFYDYSEGSLTSSSIPLAEEAGKLPIAFSPNEYLMFRFKPITLQAGKRYVMMLRFESPAAKRAFNLETARKRSYPVGIGIFYGSKPDEDGPLKYEESQGNLAFSLFDQ